MSIQLKSRNLFNIFAPNICRFLFKSFLCIDVNKVSHYNMAYLQFTMSLKGKMAACFNLEKSEISKGLLVLPIFAWYWITKTELC